MKSLHISVATVDSTKAVKNPNKKSSHILNLLLASTKPDIRSINIPAYALNIITLLTSIVAPPFVEFTFTEYVVMQKLF